MRLFEPEMSSCGIFYYRLYLKAWLIHCKYINVFLDEKRKKYDKREHCGNN